MGKAKRARTAETPKLPSLRLRLSAPLFYLTIDTSGSVRGIDIASHDFNIVALHKSKEWSKQRKQIKSKRKDYIMPTRQK
ncbi:MAG: hypothetical protein U9Q84_04535, partial [Thermodesulfobacteriota bacterium]|nr:hypothetical protein [Thermodesulfobacteriota bacterium]